MNKKVDCVGDEVEAGTRKETGEELAGLNAAEGRTRRGSTERVSLVEQMVLQRLEGVPCESPFFCCH